MVSALTRKLEFECFKMVNCGNFSILEKCVLINHYWTCEHDHELVLCTAAIRCIN